MFSTGSKASTSAWRRKSPLRHTVRRRLRFEAMEARRLLAVYIVDSFSDSPNGLCAADDPLGNDTCTLRAAIIAANANPGPDEIRLAAGTYTLTRANSDQFGATEGSLDINDSLTLIGVSGNPADVIIDGNQLDSVFEVSAFSGGANIAVRFESITIRNGAGFSGGAISADSSVSLEINNSILENNRSTSESEGQGGAVATFGSLLIENSIITGNTANNGGGVAFESFAGATLTVRNSTFSANTARFPGEGGGLYAAGFEPGSSVTLFDTTFDQNSADDLGGGGAAITGIEDVVIGGSQFTANTTDSRGGGLSITDSGSVVINQTSFDANVAGPAGGAGLYISATNTLAIADSNFNNNQASGDGGGIFADGSAAAPISVGLTNVSFLQNRGSGGGGAALFFASLANITGGDFNGNVAEQSGGGGLQVRDSQTLTISDTNFVSNQTTVESDGGGGLLVRRVGPVQISGSSFGGNAAFGGQGGGLLYSDSESLTVQLSSFRNNSANRSGGGLRADGFVADDGSLGGPVSLTDVVLEGNTAGKEGGGAYLYLVGQVDVADSQFVVNTSGESGGGLYILDTGPVLIARSTFDGNIADGSGGGLSLLSDAEVEDSLFQNNLVRNPRDYGDAPESYLTLQASGGPSHGIIPGLSLGQTVDREADGQPSSLADGDDFADSFTVNDEDGVRLLAPLTPGADASFEVIVTNATQQSGFLQAWFDFNQNGTFDPEEQTVVDQTLAAGTNTVSISIPASAQPGALYTRWRYSLTPGLGSGGAADSGEVEDHLFDVTAQTSGPTAVDDTYEIPQGSVNTLLDVLNNDLFGSFGFGALFVSTPPQNGSVTSIDGQTFQYTPNAGFAGTDEFVYTLSDSQGNLSSATATINLPPGAASDDLVRYGIEFLDIITNQPISDIQAGNEFLARVTVEDLRPSFSQTGVFSGYLDLLYNSTLVAVAPDPGNPLGSDIRFGSEFQNFKTGNASTPGLIDEVGAFRTSQTPPTGPEGPVELFTVRLQAVSPGTATFAANPADNMASQTTLYGRETVLDVPELQLGISSLSILSGGGAGEGEGFTAALTGEFPVSFDQGGGGIAIAQDAGFQPTVSISGSTIRDNTAPLGGGIGSANANLTIIDSSILGNQATSAFGGGGGIGFSQEEILSNVSRVALLISGSTIDGNTSAADAAGVGIADADATITRSSVTNNSAVGRGGGIGIIGLANAPTVIIDATTISLNSASGVGGGIAAIDAGIDLLNVTISDNFAGDIGGGIAYANTDDRVTGRARFTTIATNTSVNPGSNVASGPAPLDFTSSLIAEPLMVLGTAINFAATPTGVSSSGSNLDSDGSGGFDQAGDLSGVDPLLGPLADNGGPVLTRALLAGSPAIDASGATPLESLVGDARGLVRFRDGDGDGVRLSDIGAFEVQETLSLGDLVFFDADNNGVFDPAVDSPIAGANLSLIRDANGNGVFDPGEPSIAQTQSDSSGGYLFTGLVAGDYIVQVDPSNAVVVPFVNSPLLNPIPSTANQPAADPDDDIDNDNNGFVVSGGGVFSRAITLMLGTEPDPLGGPPQSSANLTLDFGFVSNTILAVADAVQVPEDTPLTIDVLANDSDDVDSALTLVSVSTASSGTVQIIGNQIVYTPATGFTGPDSFTYVVTNPFEQQATGIVQVQVTPVTLSLGDLVFFDADNNGVFDPAVDSPLAGVNLTLIRDANGNGVADPGDPAIAQAQSDSSGRYLFTDQVAALVAGDYIVQLDPSNAVVFGSITSPLLNGIPSTANQPAADPDDDVDNDNNGLIGPSGGVFSRAITLMPGTEPDPLGGPPQSSTNLTLDFGFISNTLLAVADAVTTSQATPITIDVLANDSDDVDSALTLVSVSTASSGTVQIIGNQIVYTPATGFTGPDSFTYVVTNPFAQQATGTVSVQVTPVAADVVDLAVSIEAFPQGEVVPGQLVDFSVFVQNLSDLTASGVVVDTTLSGNLIFQSGSSDFGSPSHLNNVVTFDGFSLPPGSSASFSITALLNPEASPPFEEFAFTEVSSDLNDPVTDNNFASVDLLGSSVDLHTLTTGSDDGGVVLQVDAFGGFGSARFSQSSLAEYNPLGPISAAGTVFNSYITVREGVSGPRESLQTAESSYSIDVPIAGNDTVATSRFRSDSFMVDLTQTVEPTFDAQGNRLGSRLVQSYAISNTTTDPRLLDLARYVDADLLFDGSLIDGGGLLVNSEGSLVLFTTDSGGTGASDTTFVGISASGGTTPLTDRFDLDDFAVLRERVLAGEPLRDLASGDLDGDGFINPGEEYDVAMALRNLLSLAAGQTLTYQTITHFGTRPQSIVPPQLAGDLVGRVFCDLDGDGIDDAGEGSAGVRVFLDRNGNRLFDEGGSNPEPFTFTDSDGNYVFVGLELPVGSTANVVTQNPPGCFPQAPEIGVTRVAMPTGRLSRAIETVDFNGNGQMDLIVANDLSNDLTVLINNNGNFSVGQTIPLGNRPQSLSAWRADSQSPAVIAVAAIGTPTTGGLVYVVENGTVRSFPSGDGPISVIVDDFNADGSPDFVTASFRSGTIVGRFSGQSEPIVLASANSPRSVTSAFINDDSAPDLVVVSSGFSDGDAYEVIVLLNDGNGNFSPARESIEGLGGVDATTADFNGDGRADIVVASYDGTVRIFGFDASGSAFEPLATVTTEKGIAAVAAADLNADGFVDLVIANARAETIELFLGNSDGFVRNRTVTGVPSPTGLAVTDFNADGLLDVAVANLFGSSNPFRLPSTATILELTVSERDVQLTSQTTQASFGFHPLPAQRTIRPAEAFPLDINRDGEVTAFDALLALNASQRVHSPASGEGESAATVRSRYKTDVNGDGLTTPLDALLVLNRMAAATRSAASPSGESLEVQALEVNALEGQTLEASDLATDVLEQIRRRRELAVDQLFSAASFLF